MIRSRDLRPFFFLANGEVSSHAPAASGVSNQVINTRLAACLAAQPFTQNLQVPLWVRARFRVVFARIAFFRATSSPALVSQI